VKSYLKQFTLPDIGGDLLPNVWGLTEAEILKWHVRPGDRVRANQVIVEVETAKVSAELPCPWAGLVTELLADEGTVIDVGTPIIIIDTGAGDTAAAVPTSPPVQATCQK
jgi:2-oxoisovalerate dehydrogenase E2 component (dihydrolipoyl transacylase)